MQHPPELFWLALTALVTALFWAPYVLNRIAVLGLMGALGNPSPDDEPQSPWANRAQRAHVNAIENFAVFAPLVLGVAVAGVSSPVTVVAVQAYFWARLGHYIVYAAGIPVVRTLLFFVGVGAEVVLAFALLQSV